MSGSKDEAQQRFNKANDLKNNQLASQTRVFQELLMFMDYKIRDQLKTFTLMALCNGEKTKFMVDSEFQRAFKTLTLQEQVSLYEKTIQIAISIQNDIESKESRVVLNIEDDKSEPIRFRLQVQKGFRSWQQIYFTLQGFKVASQEMQFDLRNYLLRKSKKKDRQCYVLEAIHHSSPETIRFCFLTNSDIKKHLPLIKELLQQGYIDMIKRMYDIDPIEKRKNKLNSPSNRSYFSEEKKMDSAKSRNFLSPLPEQVQIQQTQSRIVQEIIKQPQDQNLSAELKELISNQNEKYQIVISHQQCQQTQKWHKNVFHVMFPTFQLSTLDSFDHYKVVHTDQQASCFIFQNQINPQIFKLQLLLKLEPQITVRGLTNVPLWKVWHPEVLHGDIKLGISSDNCTISYQKHKSYSKWYRERDFLYLRHVFKMGLDYFIADKSIENTNFIPFDSIQRGKIIYEICKVSPSSSGSKLIIECQINHDGMLNRSHCDELTLRYLLGFKKIQSYFKKLDFQEKLQKYFAVQWKVKQTASFDSSSSLFNKPEVDDSQFSENKISKIDDSDVFFSIRDQSEIEEDLKNSIHELEDQPIITKKPTVSLQGEETIILNEDGIIILPKNYLKMKHPLGVVEDAPKQRVVPEYDGYLLRNVWRLLQSGGLTLINKKMMAAQDNVLSHIIGTLKKNLFSGKGALNISLPVTIFNCDSQLSRYALALGSAPEYLQLAAQSKDPIQRMKYTMILGLTHSLFFIDMEKPFNPILGETYQCFIAGCPFYAEQISHHPPISAIYMIGRGYKIFASLQATVNIHLNAADGINIGWYHVLFDDGQQICFQTPPAQFSGFTVGDRKFQFKQKGYYFDKENNLFGEMNFEDTSGVFSSHKWKYRDQVEAEIVTVKSDFFNKFIDSFPKKKHSPSSKDILERHSKLEGRWPLSIFCDGQKIFDIDTNLPFQVVNYPFPLNSNTNYREDLYYRKMEDLARSQSEKERLQVIQRGDRKLREKYNPTSH